MPESSTRYSRFPINEDHLIDASRLIHEVKDGINGKKKAEWSDLEDFDDVKGFVECDLERDLTIDLSEVIEAVRFSLIRVGVEIEENEDRLTMNFKTNHEAPDIYLFRTAMVDAINSVIGLAYPNLEKHQKQVANLTRDMLLQSDEEIHPLDVEAAYHGASIHDIGKLFVNKSIVDVREKVHSIQLRQEFSKHPRVGSLLLEENIVFNDPRILEIVEGHHERVSGTGYPNKLVKDQMSTPLRYAAIADCFATATDNERTYKVPLKVREALYDIWRRSKHFRFPDQMGEGPLQKPWYDIEDFGVLFKIMWEKIQKKEFDPQELEDKLSDEEWNAVLKYRDAA